MVKQILVGVTNLLAKAAKKEGVKIFQNSPVQKILIKNKKSMWCKIKR